MKKYQSHQTIIFGLVGTAIALGLLSPKTVNAQAKLNSISEIGWSIRLSNFDLEEQGSIGQVYSFKCPAAPDGNYYAPVWGTDLYTLNSGLCQAAVHAGMITNDGGLINVELTSGQSTYQGSDRFGISSKSSDQKTRSFKFLGNPVAIETEDQADDQPRRQSSAIERTVGNGVRRGIERTISDTVRDIFR